MAIKRRKRRARSKGKSKNLYFNAETQEAIEQYQKAEELEIKHQLYVTKILPAFDKLVENLIFIHGFTKSFGMGSVSYTHLRAHET